ncbi:MAG: NTP transferase domain-containing protein [Acidobacteriota bacterium]
MKAVILAAGRGSRIFAITHGEPKCLLSFCGRTILDFQLESLFRVGVTDLAIVVGHAGDQVTEHVKRHFPDHVDRIAFITNPDFATTNNMYSLWLAKDWLNGSSFLCLNADVICHPDIIRSAAEVQADVSVVIDPEFREETTKVIVRDDRVVALKKSIDREEASGTFIGIATFSAKGSQMLFEKTDSLFGEGQVTQYFNDVIGLLAADGERVDCIDTGSLAWAEVDDAEDWEFAQDHVCPELEAPVLSESSLPD